ncbi:DHH family phosphoesterase [archaeon]|nr:DHH family phosphoesterase [archaeon]
MPKVNEKQAKEFLNSITKKDKVAVIHHDDLDGFASGSIFYGFAKNKGARVQNFMGGYGANVKKLLKKLDKFNKIIITDLGPGFVKTLNSVLKEKKVFYTDHHPDEKGIAKNVLELRTTDRGYLPSSRTAFELTGLDEWKGIAGVMGDMGHKYKENDELISSFFKKEKITAKKFLEEVVFNLNKFIIYNHKKPQIAFDFLVKLKTYKDLYKIKKKTRAVEDEIQKHIKNFKKDREDFGKIKLYALDLKYPVKSTVTSVSAFKFPKSAVFMYVKNKNLVKVSGRNQGGNINVRELLQKCTEGFENAVAGGHDKASGASFHPKYFKKFKDNLKEYAKHLK